MWRTLLAGSFRDFARRVGLEVRMLTGHRSGDRLCARASDRLRRGSVKGDSPYFRLKRKRCGVEWLWEGARVSE